jgi:hypothetical protein
MKNITPLVSLVLLLPCFAEARADGGKITYSDGFPKVAAGTIVGSGTIELAPGFDFDSVRLEAIDANSKVFPVTATVKFTDKGKTKGTWDATIPVTGKLPAGNYNVYVILFTKDVNNKQYTEPKAPGLAGSGNPYNIP